MISSKVINRSDNPPRGLKDLPSPHPESVTQIWCLCKICCSSSINHWAQRKDYPTGFQTMALRMFGALWGNVGRTSFK